MPKAHPLPRLLLVTLGAIVALVVAGPAAAARDSDGDGMPNRWEVAHDLNPHRANGRFDADHDGLRNIGEFRRSTRPHDRDTEDDGIDDGDEVHVFGSNPHREDVNSNGRVDGDDDQDQDEDEDSTTSSVVVTFRLAR